MTETILGTRVSWSDLELQLRSALKTEARFGANKAVLNIGEGNGFVSVCGLVTCDWTGAEENEQLPSKIVIKIPSAAPMRKLNEAMPEGQRMFQGDDLMWERLGGKVNNIEVASYEFLAGFGGLAVPRCFYGIEYTVEAPARAHICLEYIENSRNMNFHERHTVEQLRQVARALGKIQASSLKRAVSNPELHRDLFATLAKTTTLESYTGFIDGLGAMDASVKTAETLARVKDLLPVYHASNLPTTIHRQMGFAPVLVNGDMRTENVLIDRNSGDVAALIDWQVTHLGVGVEDLLRISFYALPTAQRRESAGELIAELHSSIVENLDGAEPPYTLEELHSLYDLLLPHCALFFTTASVMAMKETASDPALSGEQKRERRAVQLEKVLGVLEDVVEYDKKNQLSSNNNLKFKD